MKRSQALWYIANQLDFLNGKFQGSRDNFTKDELANADVILTTLEEAGMQPPPILKNPEMYIRSTGDYGYEVNEWEPESN